MAACYEEGATVYEIAEEFRCHRTTVAARLKKTGVQIRISSPNEEKITEMVRLYESGMPLAKVSERIGYSSGTVHNYLSSQGVQIRDSHGRAR
jgi:DNA-directed RNA polymerase specialized sigma24 family protein